MTHQTQSLEKDWKLFPATLKSPEVIKKNRGEQESED